MESFFLTDFLNETDAPRTALVLGQNLVIITNTNRSKRIPTARRSHLGTSSRRVASGSTGRYTLIVLRRDDITLVARAYFAAYFAVT